MRGLLSRLPPSALWGLPLLIFAVHGSVFGGWLVDDAGISFAYARSLAGGHGLVAQPGAAPVEGYSNPLWVALYAVLYALGLMHLPWTPKSVALVLTGATFWLIARTLRERGATPAVPLVASTALALNTSFVVWSVSGLEGPLLGLLLVILWRSVTRASDAPSISSTTLWPSALCTVALALTRPDAIAYAAVPPLALCPRALREPAGRRGVLLAILAFVAVVLSGAVVISALRWWYFGDVLPNTFRVKGGPGASALRALMLMQPQTLATLALAGRAWVSDLGSWWVVLLAAGVLALALRRGLRPMATAALCLTLAGAAIFVLLPQDWMGEFRFAFGFLVASALLVPLVALGLAEEINGGRRSALAAALVVAWLGSVAAAAALRTPRFALRPTVPLSLVADSVGDRFNRFARMLEVDAGSILTPDVGGSLLASSLRVYDLGQLTDRTIARTMNADKAAFHDYVFETARPTFIMTHEVWTLGAEFERDLRFARDYVALDAFEDPTVLELSGRRLQSGVFVRREVVAGREVVASSIGRELRSARLGRQP